MKAQISQSLQTYIKDNIDPIRDIKRLQEYKEFLDINTILDDVKKIDTKQKVWMNYSQIITKLNLCLKTLQTFNTLIMYVLILNIYHNL